MRVGDFAVEMVPCGGGRVREMDSGHVLARPGQVYRLRLRNLGPLYCVVDVDVDGQRVTAGGLVLEPWGTTELEGPIDGDDGRFTVVAEGDESVFGPDGGRDDPALGLVEARFRRELPRHDRREERAPVIDFPALLRRLGSTVDVPGLPFPRRVPGAPPEWAPPLNRAAPIGFTPPPSAFHTLRPPPEPVTREDDDAIERAAGTGLTGHADQRFVPIALGPLEPEATVIRLRLVIGTEAALAEEAPRPLAESRVPPRPAARP